MIFYKQRDIAAYPHAVFEPGILVQSERNHETGRPGPQIRCEYALGSMLFVAAIAGNIEHRAQAIVRNRVMLARMHREPNEIATRFAMFVGAVDRMPRYPGPRRNACATVDRHRIPNLQIQHAFSGIID